MCELPTFTLQTDNSKFFEMPLNHAPLKFACRFCLARDETVMIKKSTYYKRWVASRPAASLGRRRRA